MLGIPLGLTVLIALRRYVESGFEGASRASWWHLGAIPAVLVITHMHSFLALVLLCGMYLLFNRRNYPQWLTFAVSAGLPSAVLFALLYAGSGAGGFIEWYPGWLTQFEPKHRDIPLWLFLWLNWGAFLPIAAVSLIRFRYYRDPLVLGGVVLFVLCFPAALPAKCLGQHETPHLEPPAALRTGCALSGTSVVETGPGFAITAVALLVFTIASGSLDLWRMTRTENVSNRMWSRDEIALAEDFRKISEPTSLVSVFGPSSSLGPVAERPPGPARLSGVARELRRGLRTGRTRHSRDAEWWCGRRGADRSLRGGFRRDRQDRAAGFRRERELL